MMRSQEDLKLEIGRRYGRLIVVARSTTVNSVSQCKKKRAYWDCLCDCGNTHRTSTEKLRSGRTRSCGCLRKCGGFPLTHGLSDSSEYHIWQTMKARCVRPSNNRYSIYGGRGITVCDRWRTSFEAFYADMGPRPSSAHSIDRIDSNGNYGPENCRWSTRSEQSNNKRNNRLIEVNGERLNITEWSKRTGLSKGAIWYRVNSGWNERDAVSTPLRKKSTTA